MYGISHERMAQILEGHPGGIGERQLLEALLNEIPGFSTMTADEQISIWKSFMAEADSIIKDLEAEAVIRSEYAVGGTRWYVADRLKGSKDYRPPATHS